MQKAITVVGRNPTTILTELSNLCLPESSSKTLLFTLAPSSNVSPRQLSALTTSLTKHFPVHVGCIAAPIPLSGQRPAYCSVSLALVDGIPFRSTIPGLPEIQVGRWHAGRNRSFSQSGARPSDSHSTNFSSTDMLGTALMSDGKVDWEKVWSVPSSSGQQTRPDPLPEELRNIEPSTIGSLVYFSDKSPEGISSGLQNAFPNAHKLALLASSTPFLTGRPFTLFHNGRVHSSGAVGIAFPSSTPTLELAFPPLVALTPPLSITGSEGNLLLSIDSRNPTRLLLSALQEKGFSFCPHTALVGKDDAFYVGVIENGDLVQVHRISSGDPSRGTIVLDTNIAPREGSTVRVCRPHCRISSVQCACARSQPSIQQLYHLPRQTCDVTISTIPDFTPKLSLSLLVSPEIEASSLPAPDLHPGDDGTVTFESFIAASENGVVLSPGNSFTSTNTPWACKVPGGRATLSWD
ncbi:hypothetical protein EDC04DRAFT_2565652 [Pisolithus marmoratus]|nr:hypothetical protein EDC04DRAFT_2565652 [Pisolithus marmoratus]